MLSMGLVLAAPSPQAQQFAQQMCEYYATVLEGVKVGDAAAKGNDAATAHARFVGAQQQLEAGAAQLERGKAAGVLPDDVKVTCAAGTFTGKSLAAAFKSQAKAVGDKAKVAEGRAKAGGMSDAQKAETLESLGKTLDAAEALEKDAAVTLKSNQAKGLADLEKASKTYQWLLDGAAQVTKEAKLTKRDTVPTKGGALALPALVKRAEAGKKRADAALATVVVERERVAARPSPPPVAAAVYQPPRPAEAPVRGQPAAPEPPREVPVDYVTAATFAAGRCSGSCAQNGWESGGSRTTCSFGNCLKDGWETTHPDGRISRTRCSFGDCLKNGWDTSHPDGKVSRTSCSFGDCAKDGWDTDTPKGTARASCNFGDCFNHGWETQVPGQSTVRCQCEFGDCLANGARCN